MLVNLEAVAALPVAFGKWQYLYPGDGQSFNKQDQGRLSGYCLGSGISAEAKTKFYSP
jgi:hypothetical protein